VKSATAMTVRVNRDRDGGIAAPYADGDVMDVWFEVRGTPAGG
jgi:hypothetical protein